MTQWPPPQQPHHHHHAHRAQIAHHDERHDGHDATAAAHQAACLMCYRFYRRGMEVEGWRLAGAGVVTRSAGARNGSFSAAVCPVCSGGAHISVRMWRTHPVDGEKQELCVCRDCGHVELREYRPARHTMNAAGAARVYPGTQGSAT